MQIGFNNKFDTNIFFPGGAGMFIQYHDIIKPVYLWATLKMILNKEDYNLPVNILSYNRSLSIIEWYVKRRYQNPLACIDYLKKYDHSVLDKMLLDILNNDESLYRLAPTLNAYKMLSVYKSQHMSFPIFIYSNEYEHYIETDITNIFSGLPVKYVYGDLRTAVSNCSQNFTYMISDIELFKKLADMLIGSYSHLILAHDYRYNFSDNHKTLKYNLYEMSKTHLYLRIQSFSVADLNELAIETDKILLSYKKGDVVEHASN
jgi:hypothetical protein